MTEKQFKSFVTSNYQDLLKFSYHFTKDSDDAADLVQESLYKIYKNYKGKDKVIQFKALAKKVIYNTFVTHYQRIKRRLELRQGVKNQYNWMSSVQSSNRGESHLILNHINKKLNNLDQKFSRPFKMRIHGYSYDEISKTMDCPIGTIKSRINTARRILREQLKVYRA